MKIMTATREAIEKDFTFVGFLIMENRLKPITTEIVNLLQNADIKTIMVTGNFSLLKNEPLIFSQETMP